MRNGQRAASRNWVVGVAVFGAVLLVARSASADVIDDIIRDYKNAAGLWIAPLQQFATTLFWSLAAIEFTWAMGSMAFRGADISDLLAELVKQIFFIGIFFFLVQNSSTLANDIVQSFRLAAAGASNTVNVSPSSIFLSGVQIATQLVGQIQIGTFGSGLGIAIVVSLCAMIIIVVVGYITAITIMVNVEAYIIIAALTLFTGFGGSRWTKDYAMRSLVYAISVGGKLFMLNLVASLGEQLLYTDALIIVGQNNLNNILLLIGTVIVLAAVIKQLPDMVASLLSGAAIGQSAGLFAVASAIRDTAVTTTVAAAGAGAATLAAGSLAAEQTPPTGSRAARFASFTGNVGRNLMTAAMADIGGRLSGTRTSAGSMGFRMAADMQNKHDATKPKPITPGGSPVPGTTNGPTGNTISDA